MFFGKNSQGESARGSDTRSTGSSEEDAFLESKEEQSSVTCK